MLIINNLQPCPIYLLSSQFTLLQRMMSQVLLVVPKGIFIVTYFLLSVSITGEQALNMSLLIGVFSSLISYNEGILEGRKSPGPCQGSCPRLPAPQQHLQNSRDKRHLSESLSTLPSEQTGKLSRIWERPVLHGPLFETELWTKSAYSEAQRL